MEEIKTSFNGKDGNGGLTLYANPFGTGKKFYGRFERDVLSMENLVSRVQQKNPGADEIIINTAISYIKREILAALKEGKAVNLMDLGELYIGASGSVASDSASDVQDLNLCVKFSASQILKDSIANVTIGKVVLSDTAPAINKIFNWFTGQESTALTAGKNVVLEGKRLKLGSDENCGLFLAAADEKGEVSDDEATWLDCTELVRVNTPKKIDFYLPDAATTGSAYRIVIKSNYVNGTTKRKEPVYTYSDVVTVA
jgi:nucleoid DNA-binding protein